MLELIKKYKSGFILYDLVLIAGIILVLAIPKLQLHLLMNNNHTDVLDVFFKSVTWLGDGWFAVVFSLCFLFLRFRYFLMLFLSFSISGLIAQFLKRIVFSGALRPAAFLDQMPGIDTVAGVELHHTMSFPSGHTTTAFAVLLLAGLIFRNRMVFLTGIILSWAVAVSRVYLSQHFLADVLAGSVLGTLSALFFYWYFQGLKPEWLDRSILTIFKDRKK
ncbi:MAG TPA: phosphatase PAP2 family protein [Bacteroides sp.]|nr:phosphatase PAP2 family protein [Bacteroides sp.]